MAKKAKNLKKIKMKKFFKENSFLLAIGGAFVLLAALAMIFSLGENKQDEVINSIYGDDEIQMHYFHDQSCPNCMRQDNYLPELEEKYPNLNVIIHSVNSADTPDTYRQFAEQFEELDPNRFPGTPLTIVGDQHNVGFGTADTTGPILESMVAREQDRIDSEWDDETMQRTIDARREYLEENEE